MVGFISLQIRVLRFSSGSPPFIHIENRRVAGALPDLEIHDQPLFVVHGNVEDGLRSEETIHRHAGLSLLCRSKHRAYRVDLSA